MKIIVCVKQVPDTSGKVAVNPDGTLDRASMQTILNPAAMNAAEAPLALKHQLGCPVLAVSLCPPPPSAMLLELKAMRVARRLLLSAPEFPASDPFPPSQIPHALHPHIRPDTTPLPSYRHQAIDGDTAQVGPQIAEKLDLPQVSYVADIKKDGNTITVKRMLEDGYMTVAVQTPCLLTCIKELNEPRYMSIRGILDCDKEPIEILDYNALKDDPLIEVDTIGLKGSPTNIYKSFTPPQKGVGMMLEGDGKDAVDQLFGILTAKHII
mgnify:CR=1 FL=1